MRILGNYVCELIYILFIFFFIELERKNNEEEESIRGK